MTGREAAEVQDVTSFFFSFLYEWVLLQVLAAQLAVGCQNQCHDDCSLNIRFWVMVSAMCSLEVTGHTLGQDIPLSTDEVLYSGCHQI